MVAGDLGHGDVEGLCVALAPLTSLAAPETVRVDLSGLRSLGASCSAVLVSALRTAHARGLCDPLAQLRCPAAPAFEGWLDRPGLRRMLEQPADGSAAVAEGCGCEPFSSVDGIVWAREALLLTVSRQARLDDRALTAVRKLIWDLAQNVLVHARIGGGVAAARVDGAARTLELAVADRGIGIRESFLRGGDAREMGDDASAVAEALRAGVTSEPGLGKGMGLYLAKLMLAKNEGSLTVRSGRARIETPSGARPAAPLPDFGGTIVTAFARLDRPLDSIEVEELLARPEGVAS